MNPASDEPVGVVDGGQDATSQRFHVVLAGDTVVQLDDVVAVSQRLPDGTDVTHYGIVVETARRIEGAAFASDTVRIARDRTMPGETASLAEVQLLRTVPERWLSPEPGQPVHRAAGAARDEALFVDQMDAPLPVGLDQAGQPVHVDFTFLNGEKGGHVNISGISGVATKTSYALFLLYQLLETERGRRLLGAHAPGTRAVVFNVKGEDLLHLDRPNRRFAGDEVARAQWEALGVPEPGAFGSVQLYCPPMAGSPETIAPDVHSRQSTEVSVYGWTPWDFIRQGLLRFCFSDADEVRTQVGFVEQRVRAQLARHAHPLAGGRGAVVLTPAAPPGTPQTFERAVRQHRDERQAGDGHVVRDFGDLVDFLTPLMEDADPDWTGGVQQGTSLAFLRRLFVLVPRIGHLVTAGVEPIDLEAANLSVVDIHQLHDSAQRFVVGALLHRVFEDKQGAGREPLRFVVLDELNKYAPREGRSPLKDLLVDVAERGRSLGVLLVGAQQAASDVAPAIVRNAAVKVAGRLDAGESGEYKFLTPELRERATRFLPGTMVLDQPLIPAPLPIRFPFPPYATNKAEGEPGREEVDHAAAEVFERL